MANILPINAIINECSAFNTKGDPCGTGATLLVLHTSRANETVRVWLGETTFSVITDALGNATVPSLPAGTWDYGDVFSTTLVSTTDSNPVYFLSGTNANLVNNITFVKQYII